MVEQAPEIAKIAEVSSKMSDVDDDAARFEKNVPASEEALHALRSRFAGMPDDYTSWLQGANGGEGFLGDSYVILWRAEEIEQFNKEYEVEDYAPGLILIGSSGGGEGYAFDTRGTPWSVVSVPFIGMDLRHAIPVGRSFSEFMSHLSAQQA